ncbi:MAG: flavodoxin family protein [Negativicutes bacterium]|nr:flavodoxin family protein [Negativicutes bacterium]
MKVIAFNGSPRRNGNTAQSIQIVLAQLEKEGIETELIQLGGQVLSGCTACGACRNSDTPHCVIENDPMNSYIQKCLAADGIIIGSPVFFGNVTPEVKAFIDRVGFTTGSNLRNKVGASVVAGRRAGSNFTYAAINFFFGIKQMIIPTSSYWNMTLASAAGDVQKDAEGIRTFERLGENMAWLLKKIQ